MTQSAPRRIAWLDTARAYGIFLVFYGHFAEVLSHGEAAAALLQQKLIYAVHMPLFIVLSGYVARDAMPGLLPFVRKQAATRLLPVVFFSVLMMPVSPALESLMGREGWPPGLQARWIDDWQVVGRRLVPPHGEANQAARARLWSGMDAASRSLLRAAAAGDSLTPPQRDTVAAAINARLDLRELFGLQLFAGAKLPPGIQKALDTGTSGLADGDPVRSHNTQLTWWTLYPEEEWWWHGDGGYWHEWLQDALATLRGYPDFNWLTWFLVCLFTIELYHFLMARMLTSMPRIVLAIAVFAGLGYLATMDVGRRQDFWFARESVVLYAFYLLGWLLRRSRMMERCSTRGLAAALLLVTGTATLLTFDLNPGSPMYNPVVLVNLSQHGHYGLFLFTAFSGSLAVMALAQLTPHCRLISLTGRHTLMLMALSYPYFRPINYALADVLPVGSTHVELLLWCTGVSVAQMATLAPLIWLLVRYVPQLVGRPRQDGPWLPRLVPG